MNGNNYHFKIGRNAIEKDIKSNLKTKFSGGKNGKQAHEHNTHTKATRLSESHFVLLFFA